MRLVDSLKGNESLEEIKETLKKAYSISDDCLDAITLLSRFENNIYKREELLINAYRKAESKGHDFKNDDIFTRQYMRLLDEIVMFYMDIGKLPLALKYAQLIKDLKGNIFEINDVLYGLYTYFGKKIDLEVTGFKKDLVDMLYAYERSDYLKAKEAYDRLVGQVPGIKTVAYGDESVTEENKKASSLLREYAYYINRMSGVIDFMKEGKI